METEQELKLKARAYDLIVMNEQIQRELAIINQQLQQLKLKLVEEKEVAKDNI